MDTPGTIAVAGATGRAGRYVVDVLRSKGHNVVAMSRSNGVDIITGKGLAEALVGVRSIVDVATGDSPEQAAATEFFTVATRNLQEAGARAGVSRIVVVSIIGIDRFTGGYGAAKLVHEQAMLSGSIPAQILRAAQFHELVAQLTDWGRDGEVSYVPRMRTQLVSAQAVGQELADLAVHEGLEPSNDPIPEIAGPRVEELVEMATLLAARRGDAVRIEGVTDPNDPDGELYEAGALLPGPPCQAGRPDLSGVARRNVVRQGELQAQLCCRHGAAPGRPPPGSVVPRRGAPGQSSRRESWRSSISAADSRPPPDASPYTAAPPRLAGIGIADTVSNGHVGLNKDLVSSLYNPYTRDYETDEFEQLPADEQQAIHEGYLAILQLPGVVGRDQLQRVETATTVRVQDDETLLTDGPFVDAKEHLGGYLLIEPDDLDAALAIAARVPAARMGGAVEVRPLVER